MTVIPGIRDTVMKKRDNLPFFMDLVIYCGIQKMNKYISQVMTSGRRIKAAKGNREWRRSTSIKYLSLCQWNCTDIETIGSKIRVCHTAKLLHFLFNWMVEQWKEGMPTKEKTAELDSCNWPINIQRSFNQFLQLIFSHYPDSLNNYYNFKIFK